MTLDEIKQYKLETEIMALRADNERLRAALQAWLDSDVNQSQAEERALIEMARRALEPKP